jgi:helicase MOV-10
MMFRACHDSLKLIEEKKMVGYLEDFKNPPEKQQEKPKTEIENFEWFNKNVVNNEEQKIAIKNIVNCTAHPYPYIVFGPAGTGKTTTLVEAAVQIITRKTGSKILICAQSNSACDTIGVRLLKYLSKTKIFRLYSRTVLTMPNVDETLKSTSNFRGGSDVLPSYEELKYFDIIITTLVSSKKLHRGELSENFFDYIFVDESASTTEAECLIPITGNFFEIHLEN